MISLFWEALQTLPGSPLRLLECGSRRERPEPAGVLAESLALRPDTLVTGLDVQEGPGVDVVADLHDLEGVFSRGQFDVVLILSVLEHLRRPWVAAEELARVTRPGGLLFCQTHQFAFPTHSWPSDYYRFSADGLEEIFSEEIGWETIVKGHEYPAVVVPLTNAWAHGAKGWNFEAEETFLNSVIICRRA